MEQTDDTLVASAERLHSIAIRLLRRARVADRESGLGSAQLSALSVLYFSGEIAVTALADAEQVRQPTMSRIVGLLADAGMVTRTRSRADHRVQLVAISDSGRRLFEAARERRLEVVRAVVGRLNQQSVRQLLPLLHELADAVNQPD